MLERRSDERTAKPAMDWNGGRQKNTKDKEHVKKKFCERRQVTSSVKKRQHRTEFEGDEWSVLQWNDKA